MVTKAELDRWAKEMGLPGQGLLDYLSRTDELLIANLKVMSDVTELLQLLAGRAPGAPVVVAPGGAPSLLSVRLEPIIPGNQARSTEVINPTYMAKCLSAIRVVVFIRNAFDQDVGYSILGNMGDSSSGAYEIATGTVTTLTTEIYQLAFEEWMPYVGASLTPAVAPTAGSADVFVIIQE